MIQLTIDEKNISVDEGTTILGAARIAGVDVPTLCYHDGIPVSPSCMVCAVKIEGRENFAPSCATVVCDGMVVDASSDEVADCRKRAIELLLDGHAGRCAECGSKKDICKLRQYAIQYKARWTRYAANDRADNRVNNHTDNHADNHASNRIDNHADNRNKPHVCKTYESGLVHDGGKCIVCGICVGITREKNISPGLAFCGRGSNIHVAAPFGADIDKAMGSALDECVTSCPTGAMRYADNQ